MKVPEFDIVIGKDGKVRAKVRGASGAACMELSDLLAKIVGKQESRELTSEYYEGQTGSVRFDVKATQGRK